MTANITTRPYRPANNHAGNTQKKSGHPTQPGNRTNAPREPERNRKQPSIVYPILRIIKRIKWGRVAVLSLAVVGAYHLISTAYDATIGNDDTPAAVQPLTASTPSDPLVAMVTPEYIFRDGDGTPVDMQNMTNAWAAEAGYVKRYELTDAERWEVASVVTAEAGGEPYAGMVAVAQCILQTCEDDGIRPFEAVTKYKYSPNRPEPTEEALEAVQAVFDFGQVATSEPIKYFYAYKLIDSKWHESQDFVIEINGHRFFSETDD